LVESINRFEVAKLSGIASNEADQGNCAT
jgi:hypothetical protein